MSQSDTVRLLIINDDVNEVERLLSMLRNSGRATRAQHVPSVEGFEKLLGDQAWDLLLAVDKAKSCEPKIALRIIKKLDKDIPAIFMTESDIEEFNMALIDGLKAGARDVVTVDDDQHLLMVMTRELTNLQERRERRIADRKLRESERRCQQLLDSSRDAIAYVEDGMFLYANQSFAERFGYQEVDDILSIPVIDVIAKSDQEKYKNFMKSFKLSEESVRDLELSGKRQDKSEFGICIAVTHAIYENDSCVQLLVAAKLGMDSAELEAEIKKASSLDALTGVYNRVHMNNAIINSIRDAAEHDKYHSLHIISIDLYEEMRTSVGITGRDAATADIASVIKNIVGEEGTLGRIADEEFALLMPGTDEEQQTQKARSICEAVAEHICEAAGKTVQITVTIGICPITEKVTTPDQVFERAHIACNEARSSGKSGTGNTAKYYIPKIADANQEDNSNIIMEIIERAISKEGLQLRFQPIISLRGESSEYYEVFVSMAPDETGKAISTEEIFACASKNESLGRKLDRWCVLNASKRLVEQRKSHPKTQLILNVTNATLRDEGFPDWLSTAFKAAGLPDDALILQFSELDATSYLTHTRSFVDNISTKGAKCCMTQFGCSLDPFKALDHINVAMVKLDNSFALDIQKKNESPEHIKELLAKINALEKQSIVPFVENATLLATLWQAGAHFIQGDYVQAPSEKMDFTFSEE